jgi:hypothetical protein
MVNLTQESAGMQMLSVPVVPEKRGTPPLLTTAQEISSGLLSGITVTLTRLKPLGQEPDCPKTWKKGKTQNKNRLRFFIVVISKREKIAAK